MNKAIIMASELNDLGDNIAWMTLLNIASIRQWGGEYRKIPIHVAVFTRKKLPVKVRKYLRVMGATLHNVLDYRNMIYKGEHNESLFSRHLSCYHFSKVLSQKYDKLLYVDVDAVCLNPIRFTDRKGIVIDTIPPDFLKIDMKEGFYPEIHAQFDSLGIPNYTDKYYSMWLGQVDDSNKHLWDKWFELFKDNPELQENTYNRWESILMNSVVIESGLDIIDPLEIGGSIPTVDDGFDASHTWCHYDTFDESGYVYDIFNKCSEDRLDWFIFALKMIGMRLPLSFEAQIDKIDSDKYKVKLGALLNGSE